MIGYRLIQCNSAIAQKYKSAKIQRPKGARAQRDKGRKVQHSTLQQLGTSQLCSAKQWHSTKYSMVLKQYNNHNEMVLTKNEIRLKKGVIGYK